MSFRDDVKNWRPANAVPEGEWAKWHIEPDGNVTITLPSTLAFHLANDLLRWKEIEEEWPNPSPPNWKRSPVLRENRRESIVYGNNLEAIKVLFNRREVLALMDRVQEIKEQEASKGDQ